MVSRYRSLVAILLGAWLGASIVADIAVTQNFHAVDRFLAAPGNATTEAQLNAIGRAEERVILRRNAAEENNWIFLNWERVEIAIAVALLALLLADRARGMLLGGSVLLITVLAAEHFVLTPEITSLGRIVDGLQPSDPQYKTFWMLHGFYSGLDILKMLVVCALGARISMPSCAGSSSPSQRCPRSCAVAGSAASVTA